MKPRVRVRTRPKPEPAKPAVKRKASKATYGKADYSGNHGCTPFLMNRVAVDKLCSALLAGNTIRNACVMARLDDSTFFRYMAEAKDAEEGSPLKSFDARVKEAMATAEHRNVMVIQQAAPKNWTAAAWFLERRCPEEWGRKDTLRMGGDPTGSPLLVGTLSEKTLSDEEAYVALKAALARADLRKTVPVA